MDAVGRLSLLNDTYYRDRLCETGGMFSIANQVDNIHKIPWIGFQSWRASGRKVCRLFSYRLSAFFSLNGYRLSTIIVLFRSELYIPNPPLPLFFFVLNGS